MHSMIDRRRSAVVLAKLDTLRVVVLIWCECAEKMWAIQHDFNSGNTEK